MNANIFKTLLMIFIIGLLQDYRWKEEYKEVKNNGFFFIKHSAGMNS
jgi:hypothetical protein